MIHEKIGGAAAKLAPPHESVFGRAAIYYAGRFHLSVFPCRPQAKEPLTAHGCKDATREPKQLVEWWTRWPNANVGIACGGLSGGLFVLDIDGEDGQESLRVLERTHGELPRTPQVLTGKGMQYYFRSQGPLKNRVGLMPGIDTRTCGGYVIAPPSIHPNGRIYCWEVTARLDDIGIQPVPSWLARILTAPGGASGGQKRTVNDWQLLVSQGVREGGRNQGVAALAGHLLSHHIDCRVALELIQSWNQCRNHPPLSPDEVGRTVESIALAEIHRRVGRVRHVY